MFATQAQIDYLRSLAAKAGFDSFVGAQIAYFGDAAASRMLTAGQASELIDALKNGEVEAPATVSLKALVLAALESRQPDAEFDAEDIMDAIEFVRGCDERTERACIENTAEDFGIAF